MKRYSIWRTWELYAAMAVGLILVKQVQVLVIMMVRQ